MDCLIVIFRVILNVNFYTEIARYETFCFEALPRWKYNIKKESYRNAILGSGMD
jgi:hypothetical protein